MRKNSDLVSLALAAAALGPAILLSPWATRALSPPMIPAGHLRPAALPPPNVRLAMCPAA